MWSQKTTSLSWLNGLHDYWMLHKRLLLLFTKHKWMSQYCLCVCKLTCHDCVSVCRLRPALLIWVQHIHFLLLCLFRSCFPSLLVCTYANIFIIFTLTHTRSQIHTRSHCGGPLTHTLGQRCVELLWHHRATAGRKLAEHVLSFPHTQEHMHTHFHTHTNTHMNTHTRTGLKPLQQLTLCCSHLSCLLKVPLTFPNVMLCTVHKLMCLTCHRTLMSYQSSDLHRA